MGSVYGNYPLVMTKIAIENGHRNSEFSHSEGFHSFVSLPEGKGNYVIVGCGIRINQ